MLAARMALVPILLGDHSAEARSDARFGAMDPRSPGDPEDDG